MNSRSFRKWEGTGFDKAKDGDAQTSFPAAALDGMPIIIGGFHSMLPVSLCWLAYQSARVGRRQPRTIYIMTDEGDLPPASSRHVTLLRRLGWLHGTVTYGMSNGGDIASGDREEALVDARCTFKAELAVVCIGPGVSSSGRRPNGSGTAQRTFSDTVTALGGIPFALPRLTTWQAETTDECLESMDVSDADVRAALARYPYPISTLGRTPQQEPAYYRQVCLTAQAAWESLT